MSDDQTFPDLIYVHWDRHEPENPMLIIETDPDDLPLGQVSAIYERKTFVRPEVVLKPAKMPREKKKR